MFHLHDIVLANPWFFRVLYESINTCVTALA